DRVEDAADQDRPPDDLLAEFPRQRLNVVKGKIGPGAGAVEEELDHRHFLYCQDCFSFSLRGPARTARISSRCAKNGSLSPSFLTEQFLRAVAEHVAPRLFIKRFLDELADCKSGLHLRPGAHVRIPAFHIRIIAERKTLSLVRHGPRKA